MSCSSAHVKLQFKAHKSCVSFWLFNFVSIHTLNKYLIPKISSVIFLQKSSLNLPRIFVIIISSPVKWIGAVCLHVKMSTLDPHVNLKHILYFIFRGLYKNIWDKLIDDISRILPNEFHGTHFLQRICVEIRIISSEPAHFFAT